VKQTDSWTLTAAAADADGDTECSQLVVVIVVIVDVVASAALFYRHRTLSQLDSRAGRGDILRTQQRRDRQTTSGSSS